MLAKRFKSVPKTVWMIHVAMFPLMTAYCVLFAHVSVIQRLSWKIYVGIVGIACAYFFLMILRFAKQITYQEAFATHRVILYELMLSATTLGTIGGRIYFERGMGAALLEAVGILILVELLVWGVLKLARTTKTHQKILAACTGVTVIVGGFLVFLCSDDWQLFLFMNIFMMFMMPMLFYALKKNENVLVIFGAVMFGLDPTWMLWYCESFLWGALTALAVLLFVRTAMWAMGGSSSSNIQPGYIDLGPKFAAWLLLFTPFVWISMGYKAVRKWISGFGKRKKINP